MATIDTIPDAAGAKLPSPAQPTWLRSNWGVLLAVAALVAVLLLPTPEGLSVAGQRMQAILAFAVIVWMTEALDYAVSAVVIAALMAFRSGWRRTRPTRKCARRDLVALARIRLSRDDGARRSKAGQGLPGRLFFR